MSQCIPVDLAAQILIRLPVKSLLRFRAACKSFSRLISSKEFIDDHLAISEDSESCLLRYRNGNEQDYFLCPDDGFRANWQSAEKLMLPFAESAYLHLDIGYCNGVVCVIIYDYNDEFLMYPRFRVVLWNPSIKKHLTIRTRDKDKWARVYNFGFGYDSVSGDYKLVNIYGSGKIDVDECCLRDGKWKGPVASIGEPFWASRKVDHPIGRSVFLNGKCHWLVEGNRHISEVISFDLHSRILNKIALPGNLMIEQSPSLHIFKGCLSLCFRTRNHNKYRISLWMMKEYSIIGSWKMVYESRSLTSVDKIFGLTCRGEVVYCRRNLELISYDPVSQRIHSSEATVARGFESHYDKEISYCVDAYKETLALLDKTG